MAQIPGFKARGGWAMTGSWAPGSVYSTGFSLSFLGGRWSWWPHPGQAGPLPGIITPGCNWHKQQSAAVPALGSSEEAWEG